MKVFRVSKDGLLNQSEADVAVKAFTEVRAVWLLA